MKVWQGYTEADWVTQMPRGDDFWARLEVGVVVQDSRDCQAVIAR
jgi:hypothetical protein